MVRMGSEALHEPVLVSEGTKNMHRALVSLRRARGRPLGRLRHGVELYITESFTFRVLEDKAAIFFCRGSEEAPLGQREDLGAQRAIFDRLGRADDQLGDCRFLLECRECLGGADGVLPAALADHLDERGVAAVAA